MPEDENPYAPPRVIDQAIGVTSGRQNPIHDMFPTSQSVAPAGLTAGTLQIGGKLGQLPILEHTTGPDSGFALFLYLG